MSTSRYFNAVTAAAVALAIIVTSLLLYLSGNEEAVQVMSSFAGMPYETLFDQFEVMEVDIEIAEEDLEDMLANPLLKEYKQCDVTVNGTVFTDAAIRTKGNTSLSQVASTDSDRYSFKIEFDHYDKNKSMNGLDKLVLNNIFSDATYVKEYMAYDMFHYIGVETPYYVFASISINGENFGCYLALEAMEDSFLERVYSGSGQLYKPESDRAGGGMRQDRMPGNREGGGRPGEQEFSKGFGRDIGSESGGSDLVYTDGEIDSYSDIFDNAVFQPSDADKQRVITALEKLGSGEELEVYIDVDACLRYFAVQTFIVNMDSYYSNLKHNYYLYENGGQLTILPWDLNLAFGGFQSQSATEAVNNAIDTPMGGSMEESRPLFGRLMEVEEYRTRYHGYLNDIAEGYVNSGQFGAVLSKVKSLISPYVAEDPTAFYSYGEYEEALETLKAFVLLRAESVRKQIGGEIPSISSERDENTVLVDASSITLSTMGTQDGGREEVIDTFQALVYSWQKDRMG